MRDATLFVRRFAVMIRNAIRIPSKSCRPLALAARGLTVLLFLLLASSRGSATLHTFTLGCDSIGTFVLDSAIAGITLDDTLQIMGTSTSPTQVGIKLTDSLGVFSLSYKKPLVEEVDSPQLVILHFSPRARQGYSGSIEFVYGTCQYTLQLIGFGISPTANNTVLSLSNASREVIGFEFQNTDSASLRLSFRNDIADSIHVHSISFSSDDTVFRVDSAGTDFKVLRNATFSVRVQSYIRTPGSKLSFLVIHMPDDPILEEAIAVQSLRLTNADVAEKLAPLSHFSLSPNPSHGSVILGSDGAMHLHITITNILGQVIRDDNVPNEWVWDGKSSAGIAAPAGTYYVFASGKSPSGKYVQQVLPLILMK